MLDFQLDNFWDWFKQNANHLHSDRYDTTLLKELDQTISNWGLGWEIGPGLTKENSLTISPNGDAKLLAKASEIIDSAPKFDNWEFYFYKQPKENWDKTNFGNAKIDASDWTYVLLKYPDDKIEILIKADNIKHLDTSTKELAVDLVLTNLLGEKRKMEELNFVAIVDEHENKNGITQLKYLPAHLDKTTNGT